MMREKITLATALLGLMASGSHGREKADLRGPGFGRALLALDDQDGDGVCELLIADPTVDRPGSKGDTLLVYSPGAKQLLRVLDPGIRVGDGPGVLERLSESSTLNADFVYFGEAFDDGRSLGFLIVADSKSGQEVGRISYDRPTDSAVGPTLIALGDACPDQILMVLDSAAFARESEVPVVLGALFDLSEERLVRDVRANDLDIIGDTNQDGVVDYIQRVGNRWTVNSASSGHELFELVAPNHAGGDIIRHYPVVDLNRDGIDEFARVIDSEVTERESTRTLSVHSGRDGGLLWTRNGLRGSGTRIGGIEAFWDDDNDGIVDLLVLTNSEEEHHEGCPGWEIYSGRSGRSLGHRRWGAYHSLFDYESLPSYSIIVLRQGGEDTRPWIAASRTHSGSAIHCVDGAVELIDPSGNVEVTIQRRDLNPHSPEDGLYAAKPDAASRQADDKSKHEEAK